MNRSGLQSEILAHLAVVMISATGLLAAFFFHAHSAQLDRLSGLLGRALVAEAESPMLGLQPTGSARWWRVEPGTTVGARNVHGARLDAEALGLARKAERVGQPLLQAGRPWQPIRFAAPLGRSREVAVASLPAAVSPMAVIALMVA